MRSLRFRMNERVDVPRAVRFLRTELRLVGVMETVRVAFDYWRPPRAHWWYAPLAHAVGGRKALEVGGPSRTFQADGQTPVYPFLRSWDNVDFVARTIWTPDRAPESRTVSNGSTTGAQMWLEAASLTAIPTGTYGLVLSSHVLEHLANPLRALREWKRVLVPGGLLLTVVPEGARSFDHARPATTVDHIRSDFDASVGEDHLGHLDEVLRLHDLSMDPGAGTRAAWAEKCRRNPEFRSMHHHVFTTESLEAVLGLAGFRPVLSFRVPPSSLLTLARSETTDGAS